MSLQTDHEDIHNLPAFRAPAEGAEIGFDWLCFLAPKTGVYFHNPFLYKTFTLNRPFDKLALFFTKSSQNFAYFCANCAQTSTYAIDD